MQSISVRMATGLHRGPAAIPSCLEGTTLYAPRQGRAIAVVGALRVWSKLGKLGVRDAQMHPEVR